jgi:hypothetical protein
MHMAGKARQSRQSCRVLNEMGERDMPLVGRRRRRDNGARSRNKLGLLFALSTLLGLGAGLAAAQQPRDADSSQRADDVVTQDDVRGFAEGLVGKQSAAPAVPPNAATTGSIQELATDDARTTVKLGAASLDLEPPPGHCFLDEAQPSDARLAGLLRQIFQADLRMLGAFADCAQLKSWRTGARKTLSDYGQFLVPVTFIAKKLDGPARPYVDTICAIMRENGGELIAKSAPDVKQRFEQALQGAQMNENRFLGVVGQDEHACYFGLIQKIVTEFGDPKTQVDVSTIAFIAGKMIYSNLYAVHEGDHTLNELFDRQQGNVAQNVRVNGG